MNHQINVENPHHCTSYVNGNLIVYKCPICPDYERTIDMVTGMTTSKKNQENNHLHVGVNAGIESVTKPLLMNLTNN